MNEERQKDRIMHLLLAEGLGEQKPPDLSAQIMDRAFPVAIKPPAFRAPQRAEPVVPTPTFGKETYQPPMRSPEKVIIPSKRVQRPLIFRLARPLVGAAMLAIVCGLFYYFNRPYPPPEVSGDFTVTGGGAVARGSEILTTQRTARIVLGGLYMVDMSPRTRVRIEGLPGAEAVLLMEGEVTCDVENRVGDLTIKTEFGDIRASDVHFRASIQEVRESSVPAVGGENMATRKLLVTVLSGVLSVSGPWGNQSFGAGHELAFTKSGPMAVNVALKTGAGAENSRVQGTILEVLDKGLVIQVGNLKNTVRFEDVPKVKLNDKPATLAELKPGMTVVVEGSATGTVIVASSKPTTTQPLPPANTTVTGTLSQVGQDGVTVRTATTSVRFLVASTTVVRIKDAPATLADLKVGMAVAVISTDGKTAKEIRAAAPTTNPTPPPAVVNVAGNIAALGERVITVHGPEKDTVITVTNTTVIRIQNVLATFAQLKVGMRIEAATSDGKTAVEIHASNPTTPTPPGNPVTVTGTILQLGGDRISVQQTGKTTVVTVTDATVIRIKDVVSKFADLKAGMAIVAITTDGTKATEIRATPSNTTPPVTPPTKLTGTLATITGEQITVKTETWTTTLTITSKTVIRIKDAVATLADLKPGMVLTITADGKTALEIRATVPASTTLQK